jgi:uncharacterized membrane protein YbhN (UPF0104 family)
VAAVLVVAVVAFASSGRNVADHLDDLSWTSLVAAAVAVLAGLFANLLTWRAVLADLGSRLPLPAALRVFFLGQLGKYIPGSVWPVLAQMELGKEHGVPRARSGTVGLLTVALSLVAGLLTAAATLPFTSGDALDRYWYAFLAVPVLGIGLLPAVANPVLDKLLRLARRGGLHERLTGRGMATALFWAVVAWVLFGLQVYFLADALGAGSGALPLSIGAFALAWTLGFLVVIAPAGTGVREAALVVGLSPVLSQDKAILVALVSRALMSLGDGAWAAIAVAAARRHKVAEAVGTPT